MTSSWIFWLSLLVLILVLPKAEPMRKLGGRSPLNITANAGIKIDLKCRVRYHDCGNFHSIKFYRIPIGDRDSDPEDNLVQEERVYVYFHHNGKAKAENHWQDRANHTYDTKKHVMRIHLAPLRLEDEAKYRCEIDYEFAGRWFKEVCAQTPQLTHLKVIGKPEFVTLSMGNDTEILSKNDEPETVIGPFTEGTLLVLRCEAGGGRPVPEVSHSFLFLLFYLPITYCEQQDRSK